MSLHTSTDTATFFKTEHSTYTLVLPYRRDKHLSLSIHHSSIYPRFSLQPSLMRLWVLWLVAGASWWSLARATPLTVPRLCSSWKLALTAWHWEGTCGSSLSSTSPSRGGVGSRSWRGPGWPWLWSTGRGKSPGNWRPASGRGWGWSYLWGGLAGRGTAKMQLWWGCTARTAQTPRQASSAAPIKTHRKSSPLQPSRTELHRLHKLFLFPDRSRRRITAVKRLKG